MARKVDELAIWTLGLDPNLGNFYLVPNWTKFKKEIVKQPHATWDEVDKSATHQWEA